MDVPVLSPYDPSYVYVCVTFQIDGEHDQTIILHFEKYLHQTKRYKYGEQKIDDHTF